MTNLEPSVELTGGPWYTDGELDDEFIKLLSSACLRFIQTRVGSSSHYKQHRLTSAISELS